MKIIRHAKEASFLKPSTLLWIVAKELVSFFEEDILSVQDKIYSQKAMRVISFISRESKTLDLLFAASPSESLFFPGNYLSPRLHSLLLPVAHGIMGVIECIVFHLPMTPYVLRLLQESEAWGRHSYFRHFSAGLAQSVERLTAEREVAGSNPRAGPILRVKITEKWRYSFYSASG